jgi:N-formylglutamate deformylase
MPHEAMDAIARGVKARPEVVIGDRFGASARPDIIERIEAAFAAVGLTVVRNAPFAGAYVVQHYGRPARGQHAVQIEIDRALYMDEKRVRPNGNFNAFRRVMRQVVGEIAAIGASGQDRLAAE